MMHGRGKSDLAIVAVKLTNKAERSAAEPVEPRAGTKGNADQTARTGHSAGHACHLTWNAYGKPQGLPVRTRGGSRVRESCMHGSVRGAPSNGRPYRDRPQGPPRRPGFTAVPR